MQKTEITSTPRRRKSDPGGMNSVIVGPSHVVRWKKLRSEKAIARPITPNLCIGFGGAPVWSKRNLEAVHSLATATHNVCLIVGDFRFGNNIRLQESEPDDLFVDGFSGITHSAINASNDEWMFKRSIRALEAWAELFPDRLSIMFWDLLCRQVQDRLMGRYITNHSYRHPTWDLEMIEVENPHLPIVSLIQLLRQPMHEILRLFIDSSCHPSHAGSLFIENVFFEGMDVVQAYKSSTDQVFNELIGAAETAKLSQRPIWLIGKSIWISTLYRYLGASGVHKLSQAGIRLLSLSRELGHSGPDFKDFYSAPIDMPIFIVSGSGSLDDVLPYFSNPPENLEKKLKGAKCFAWEANCVDIIRMRLERPGFSYKWEGEVFRSLRYEIRDEHIELGQNAEPTMRGLMKLLHIITAAAREHN